MRVIRQDRWGYRARADALWIDSPETWIDWDAQRRIEEADGVANTIAGPQQSPAREHDRKVLTTETQRHREELEER